MISENIEDTLLTRLHSVQRGCERGLIAPDELLGFVRTTSRINLHISERASYYESQLSFMQNRAKGLRIVYAVLKPETSQNRYALKNTLKETGYIGPFTELSFSPDVGFVLRREDATSSWAESIEWDMGSGVIHIEDASGMEFGLILELVKDLISWRSLRIDSTSPGPTRLTVRISMDSLRKLVNPI